MNHHPHRPHITTTLCRTLRSAREEQGFTLIELLIVISLLAVVLGALLTPLISAQNTLNASTNYAYAQQEARTGLDAMVSQIRQATQINSDGPNFIDMNVTLQGTQYRVYYECDIAQSGTSYNECVRLQVTQGSSLPAISTGPVVIRNLTNGTSSNPVFTWGTDPNAPDYMTATISVSASNGATNSRFNHTITFSDGALMRNLNVGN